MFKRQFSYCANNCSELMLIDRNNARLQRVIIVPFLQSTVSFDVKMQNQLSLPRYRDFRTKFAISNVGFGI
jgi:hypothetical protein